MSESRSISNLLGSRMQNSGRPLPPAFGSFDIDEVQGLAGEPPCRGCFV